MGNNSVSSLCGLLPFHEVVLFFERIRVGKGEEGKESGVCKFNYKIPA